MSFCLTPIRTCGSNVFEIVFDAYHPAKLASFWASALPHYAIREYDEAEVKRLAELGYTPETDPTVAVDGDGPTLWFQKVETKTLHRNRIHLDLRCESRTAEVERLQNLGASIRDVYEDHVVMLDPEGNQFCLFDEQSEHSHPVSRSNFDS